MLSLQGKSLDELIQERSKRPGGGGAGSGPPTRRKGIKVGSTQAAANKGGKAGAFKKGGGAKGKGGERAPINLAVTSKKIAKVSHTAAAGPKSGGGRRRGAAAAWAGQFPPVRLSLQHGCMGWALLPSQFLSSGQPHGCMAFCLHIPVPMELCR